MNKALQYQLIKELENKVLYAQMQAERYQGDSQCIQLMLDNEVERLENLLDRAKAQA